MARDFRTNDGQRLEKLIEQNEKLIEQNDLIFKTLCVSSKTIIKLGEIMAEGFSLVNKELKRKVNKMIIEMERKKQCKFKKLGIGEVFVFGSNCYMKTKDVQFELSQNDDFILLNCVNLLSGELIYVEEDTKVYTPPYSFKIIERGL